ncbi:BsuBI/PstI family type II restriction endonuclease [Pseudarthrobacter sp. J64]|uniref:BsuBI/PstI family type II restriction endonuclease n=1 Tax=Pseudarthrobacter sp. J64 TaxID=3116485 RepID=UPI002E81EBFB|nr:BsuBI/PstI family type II restriction endonuclease [Pseudarthrobacter sp. J64]MEE2570757.1 BsuBI/PstI family type II restriction endonuclease [Pseudarthrobacter sp. J64]
MNEELISITDEERRRRWYAVSRSTKNKTHELMASWDIGLTQWYADNSREPLRDDVFHPWSELGAILGAPHLDTTSPAPRWILRRSFAQLFDPSLHGEELQEAVDTWIQTHMSASARLRASLANARARATLSLPVRMPDGTTRDLAPGKSSEIIQGVIQGWAIVRLKDPAVLAISEPGEKFHTADATIFAAAGISIDVSNLLPDILIVDLGTTPMDIWVVEVVATDGPIHERRKRKLMEWAAQQGLPPENLRYLTAFLSRNHSAAKRLMPSLAAGTHAWFLDEPELELSWAEIASTIPDNIVQLSKKVEIARESERGIRTELRKSATDGRRTGWGPGTTDTEYYEYACPCGNGAVIEEHENTEGDQSHIVRIDCDLCKAEWDFVPGLSKRQWRLEPKTS